MSKCILCREREAVVPDRYGDLRRKRVCRECHAGRLRGDLAEVLRIFEEKKARREAEG